MSLLTTPAAIRAELENLIDDQLDIDFEYSLLTQAKNLIEDDCKLAILVSSFETQSVAPGDTYQTLKSVASDFRNMISLFVGIIAYYEVPFSQRINLRNAARRFYIDYKKMVQGLPCLGIMGANGSAQTIYQTYQVATPDLTQENEDQAGIVLWPDRFQKLIAYRAAKILQGNVDADDTNFRMSEEQEIQYQNLLDGFIGWDHDLKLSGMGGRLGYDPSVYSEESSFDIGML